MSLDICMLLCYVCNIHVSFTIVFIPNLYYIIVMIIISIINNYPVFKEVIPSINKIYLKLLLKKKKTLHF